MYLLPGYPVGEHSRINLFGVIQNLIDGGVPERDLDKDFENLLNELE